MRKNKLYGAILGDLAGQPFEFPAMIHFPAIDTINIHNPDSVITDDSLMTLATAKSILDNQPIEEAYKEIGLKYNGDHYGKGFKEWLKSPIGTINPSYGNGCLMRISPYMYLDVSDNEKKELIIASCLTSHAHPKSILKSLELFELYNSNLELKPFTRERFKKFAVSADKTFDFIKDLFSSFESTHEAIKVAISCGGDTDTNASIIGELMNYTYQDITQEDINYVESKLDDYQLDILKRFQTYK